MLQNRVWRGALWAALLLTVLVYSALAAQGDLFTLYLTQSQDFPVLIALPILMAIAAFWAPQWPLPRRAPPPVPLMVLGIVMVLLLGRGTYTLMGNFPLSRDEHMVVFDMAVFDKGRLAAPLPLEWRTYAQALVPAFLLNEHSPAALVSAYLPVNAMLRLAFSKVADPVFFNPVLALIGAIALYDIAKRLFGGDARARWIVILIYGLSAQMLVNTMTTYSMTPHMALNLVWLAAFLRGGRMGHIIAITMSFLAVGLHQLVFHPLFVAPFILWRLRQGNWGIVLAYSLALSVILGWWALYPRIAALNTGVPPANGSGSYDFFKMRVLPLLLERDSRTGTLMLLNLLRFIAWQNLALIPLLLAAVPMAWRSRDLDKPLLWGILGLIVSITILLPFQGHGWGYRYLHPFLGSFALLCGFGYQRLATRFGGRADGTVVALSGLTLIGAIPVLMFKVHSFVAPHVALEQFIAKQTSDFVLVDTEAADGSDGRWAANAIDHVRNTPDLDNRPLRLSSRALNRPMIAELCRRGTIRLVTHADMHRVGFAINVPERSPRFDALIEPLRDAPCLLR